VIKVSVFNKTNDVLIVDAVKNVFQRRNREILLSDVLYLQPIRKFNEQPKPSVNKQPMGSDAQLAGRLYKQDDL